MKKIMFNDAYGLTTAVAEGRKTMTRRIYNANGKDILTLPKYKVGEIVAVAQNYRDAGFDPSFPILNVKNGRYERADSTAGWSNKMFVQAEFIPIHIQITNTRWERLQDISDEDCLREGVVFHKNIETYYFEETKKQRGHYFYNPIDAFSELIDFVSGRGTWERNPWVCVYQFERVK